MMLDLIFELGWKSLIIAALGMAGLRLLRNGAPRERAAMAAITMGLVAALPVLAALLPAVTIAHAGPVNADAVLAPITLPAANPDLRAVDMHSFGEPVPVREEAVIRVVPLLLALYLAGLAALAGRLAVGLMVLRSKAGAARAVTDAHWSAMFRRVRAELGLKRPVRLLCAAEDCPPISFGVRHPVVLIDRAALARPDDAAAILRHEMAHVAHHDFALRLLSKAVRALFWFNPLVWIVDRDLEASQEEAADDMAINGMKRTDYAQALLNAARDVKGLYVANGAGSAHLEGRLSALLSGRDARPARGAVIAGAALISLAIAGPVAALQFEAAAPVPPAAPVPVIKQVPPPAPVAPQAPPAPIDVPVAPAPPPAPATPVVTAAMQAAASPAAAKNGPHDAAEDSREIRDVDREMEAAMADVAREMKSVAADVERMMADVDVRVLKASAVAMERNEARIEAAVARAEESARAAMARGAEGMLRGADKMERGADKMAAKGRQMRDDRAFRERIIAKQAKRGETVTHEDLIQAGKDLIEGAEGMCEGADDMRKAAEDMRTQDI
ncbi:M56 family metallopeptidase [Pacificimonas sp. WHA3]|uniref:M56 family metallopeptidase n=1 Tax=Pacificimonas pallii TaxID=2827236 RepID=A0ABS6SFI4_9SPHN|nr:M56 family metallopeptidase [Pacificimonas pallii]MBV7257172.1 M56 family metallopeptidase [Pacificimonas pallii]